MTNRWSVRLRPVCRAPVIFAWRKWKLSRPWMGKVLLKLCFTLSACIYQFVSKANAKQKATLIVGQSIYKHSVRRTHTKESKVISHYSTEGFFQWCSQWTHCFLSALLSNDLLIGQLPKLSSEIQSSEPVWTARAGGMFSLLVWVSYGAGGNFRTLGSCYVTRHVAVTVMV